MSHINILPFTDLTIPLFLIMNSLSISLIFLLKIFCQMNIPKILKTKYEVNTLTSQSHPADYLHEQIQLIVYTGLVYCHTSYCFELINHHFLYVIAHWLIFLELVCYNLFLYSYFDYPIPHLFHTQKIVFK